MKTAQNIASQKAYSILETLFVLLLSGVFLGLFLSSYASSVQLNIDLEIRSNVENKILELDTFINSQDKIEFPATDLNSLEQSTNSGTIFNVKFEKDSLSFVPNSTDKFISAEQCESTYEKITTDKFFYPNCFQLYIKKIIGAQDLYCYYIYSTAIYSNGKLLSFSKNGIINRQLSFSPSNTVLIVSSDSNNNDNYCVSY